MDHIQPALFQRGDVLDDGGARKFGRETQPPPPIRRPRFFFLGYSPSGKSSQSAACTRAFFVAEYRVTSPGRRARKPAAPLRNLPEALLGMPHVTLTSTNARATNSAAPAALRRIPHFRTLPFQRLEGKSPRGRRRAGKKGALCPTSSSPPEVLRALESAESPGSPLLISSPSASGKRSQSPKDRGGAGRGGAGGE